MQRRLVSFVFLAFFLFSAFNAFAAGFATYEFSARGNALGGAVMARPADVSSMAVNPALITQLNGTHVATGVTFVQPSATVDIAGVGTSHGKSNTWVIPNAYASQQINDNLYVGVGTFSRFGLGTEYDSTWANKAEMYYVGIKSLSVNPVIAFKFSDAFSFAMGVEAMWFDYVQKKKPTGDVDFKVHGDSYGYGLTAATHIKPADWLSFGVSYRTEITQNLRGTASGSTNSAVLAGLFPDASARGTVTLPYQLAFGVALMPTDDLSFEVGAVRTGWGSYSQLRIDFDKSIAGSTFSSKDTEWEDVWRYNAGVEYALSENWDVRGSFVYDESPLDENHLDFLVPANDRMLYGTGLGWHDGAWSVDVSYTYLDMKKRNGVVRLSSGATQNVEFKDGDAHIYGVSIGYSF